MSKIRRISNFQGEFCFSDQQEQFSEYYVRFLSSELGKIYSAIPWDNLVNGFGLKDSKKGPASLFSPRGKLGLMFLKHYSCCSDRKLIEQLNSNIDYQFFCDLHLGLDRIDNYKIVSDIRCELSSILAIDKIEVILYTYWKPHINESEKITLDATCYESEVRYPTDQKLLWESVDWLYRQIQSHSKLLGIKQPRTKYLKWKRRYISYSKMRKKTNKRKMKLTRSLLHLLHKLLAYEKQLLKQHSLTLPKRYYKTVNTIKKVYRQQYLLFTKGEKPNGRIVSLSKAYLRPIVRGKEIKSVEFGAKVNKLQINGISFIEHISFDAFNEGTRFISTIYKAQSLTHKKVKIAGADGIYATNKNRVFATSHTIKTDFKPKGKPSKHHKAQKQLKSLITKERASRLEGSFGKEKEHYHLKKIKAKTKLTERLWIFFGIHTANALEIGRRMALKQQKIAA